MALNVALRRSARAQGMLLARSVGRAGGGNALSIVNRSSGFTAAVPAVSHVRHFSWDNVGDSGNKHRSNAEELIKQVPIIEVAGNVAQCDGGGGALGHPLEFIQLDTVNPNEPSTCKYCGLRFKRKAGYHHH